MLKNTRDIFLTTLSNKTRLSIIEVLMNGSKNVTQICKATGTNQTTISHNLTRLRRCGFVHMKKNGKERVYHLNEETIKPLIKLMNTHIEKYCKHYCD